MGIELPYLDQWVGYLNHLNNVEPSIQFTVEVEANGN